MAVLLRRIACRQRKDAAYCYHCSVVSVCLCVCLLDTTMSPTKTTEPIELLFVVWTQVGQRNHVCLPGWGPNRLRKAGNVM